MTETLSSAVAVLTIIASLVVLWLLWGPTPPTDAQIAIGAGGDVKAARRRFGRAGQANEQVTAEADPRVADGEEDSAPPATVSDVERNVETLTQKAAVGDELADGDSRWQMPDIPEVAEEPQPRLVWSPEEEFDSEPADDEPTSPQPVLEEQNAHPETFPVDPLTGMVGEEALANVSTHSDPADESALERSEVETADGTATATATTEPSTIDPDDVWGVGGAAELLWEPLPPATVAAGSMATEGVSSDRRESRRSQRRSGRKPKQRAGTPDVASAFDEVETQGVSVGEPSPEQGAAPGLSTSSGGTTENVDPVDEQLDTQAAGGVVSAVWLVDGADEPVWAGEGDQTGDQFSDGNGWPTGLTEPVPLGAVGANPFSVEPPLEPALGDDTAMVPELGDVWPSLAANHEQASAWLTGQLDSPEMWAPVETTKDVRHAKTRRSGRNVADPRVAAPSSGGVVDELDDEIDFVLFDLPEDLPPRNVRVFADAQPAAEEPSTTP